MFASASHHFALRVGDIERASRFYVDVFAGRRLTLPYLREGPEAETTWGGRKGVRFLVSHIALAEGAVELFQFLDPHDLPAPEALEPSSSPLHFGIRVDDVGLAVAAVERAGGRRLWPEIRAVGEGVHVIYVTDLDDNVIELTDATLAEIAAAVLIANPHADPHS